MGELLAASTRKTSRKAIVASEKDGPCSRKHGKLIASATSTASAAPATMPIHGLIPAPTSSMPQ